MKVDEDMASPEKIGELQARFDGRYRFVKLLGQGGMGAVYKAIDVKLGRDVALKILPASYAKSRDRTRRFEQEARALAKLRHQGIVTVFDYGQEGSIHWLSMEYVDGKTLREELERNGKLEVERVVRLVDKICDALGAAHDAGLVHRDIKPENILLAPEDEPRIVDFGLAKLLGDSRAGHSMSSEGRVLGTADYMSPEQKEGSRNVDARSDVYSLGKVIYEMLSGRRPEGKFPSLAEIGPAQARFDELIEKALDPEPSRRHASIQALRAALPRRRAESARAGRASAASGSGKGSGGPRSKRWWVGVPAAVFGGILMFHYERTWDWIQSVFDSKDGTETTIIAALEKLDKGTSVEREAAVDALRNACAGAPPELAARIVSGLAANLVEHSPSGYQAPSSARGCDVCPSLDAPVAIETARCWVAALVALGELRSSGPAVRSAKWNLDRVGVQVASVEPVEGDGWLLFAGGSMLAADLRESKWRRADLDGVPLLQAQLGGASFQACRLVDAALRSVCARGARFRVSNLSGVDFERACLEEAHFVTCVLRGAKFRGASLKGASFVMVDLRGADFSDVEGLEPGQFVNVTWDLSTSMPTYLARSTLPASVEFDDSKLAAEVRGLSAPSPR